MRSNIQQPAWASDLHPPRWLWLLLIALPIVTIIAFVSYQSTQVLPRLALAPAYSLLDQEGKRLTNESLRGNLVLYNFIHERCIDPCVDSSRTMQLLQQTVDDIELGPIALHFVTIDTAPEPQTTQSLRAYAQSFAADSDQWHFVSGDPEQLSNFMQAESQGETMNPTASAFALVDGWGIVRAVYHDDPTDLDRIKHDLRLVAQEARNSAGVNRYAYEAVHLFMCHNDLYAETSGQR